MKYSPMVLVHILAGMAALLAGFTALLVRKGSRLHRRSGVVFSVAMLCMAASGGYVALLGGQSANVLAAVFTLYLITSGWLTVKRKANETRLVDAGLMLVALGAGAAAWRLGLAAHKGAGAIYFAFGSLLLLAAAGDIRMLVRGGVAGAQRLARHLWRMCFGLFIAAGSFFLGRAGDPELRRTGLRATLFTQEIRDTYLPAVPVLLVILLMIFWLFRVKLSSTYKRAEI